MSEQERQERRVRMARAIELDLNTIRHGHTAYRYGEAVTRWHNGVEIGTVDGSTPLIKIKDYADRMAVYYTGSKINDE